MIKTFILNNSIWKRGIYENSIFTISCNEIQLKSLYSCSFRFYTIKIFFLGIFILLKCIFFLNKIPYTTPYTTLEIDGRMKIVNWSFYFNFYWFSRTNYERRRGGEAYTSTRLNDFPILGKGRLEINGKITGSRNAIVQRDLPSRSVLPRGDNSNGSVPSGSENPDKNRVYLCPRRSFGIAKLFASVTRAPQLRLIVGISQGAELLDNTRRIAERTGYRNKTLRIRSSSAWKFPPRILFGCGKEN